MIVTKFFKMALSFLKTVIVIKVISGQIQSIQKG